MEFYLAVGKQKSLKVDVCFHVSIPFPLKNFLDIFKNLLFMSVLPAHMRVYHVHVCAQGGQKRALDSLKLEFYQWL